MASFSAIKSSKKQNSVPKPNSKSDLKVLNKRTSEGKFKFKRFLQSKYSPLPHIGVDEVGRGCLAGPVVAAAVVLNHSKHNKFLGDSKLLTSEHRKKVSTLMAAQHLISIAWATVEEIDQLNIHYASLLAMKRAVESLGVPNGHVLVDGRFTIPELQGFEQTAIVKGDTFAPPISAASIVAKVFRDEWMERLSQEFPVYGFEKHKGYATSVHRNAIAEHGRCIWHRRSFILGFENPDDGDILLSEIEAGVAEEDITGETDPALGSHKK
ncbi:MAG: ribonuclease HII [Bdellovibrionota bacterium]